MAGFAHSVSNCLKNSLVAASYWGSTPHPAETSMRMSYSGRVLPSSQLGNPGSNPGIRTIWFLGILPDRIFRLFINIGIIFFTHFGIYHNLIVFYFPSYFIPLFEVELAGNK